MCGSSEGVSLSHNSTLWSGDNKVSHLANNSIQESANATVCQEACEQNVSDNPKSDENHEQYALIYDVITGQGDFSTELRNAVFLKHCWKKTRKIFEYSLC